MIIESFATIVKYFKEVVMKYIKFISKRDCNEYPNNMSDIRQWIRDNVSCRWSIGITNGSVVPSKLNFIFDNEFHAMAFKLRWGQQAVLTSNKNVLISKERKN